MHLKDLLSFDDIVIQCHDFPDADTIASGYAVYRYLLSNGKKPRLVYSGKTEISKPNLLLFISELEIPLEYVKELCDVKLLLTVDCVHGEGNVTSFDADYYAAIDHHICAQPPCALAEIRENYASCATVVYRMLRHEAPELLSDLSVSTALYYGLYMDTNAFSEIKHAYDRDLRDLTDYDRNLILRLHNANFTLSELEIAGEAFSHNVRFNQDKRFAIVKVKPCDPSILAIICDLVLQVDDIDTDIVFCELPNGIKFSVRSCVNEIRANEIAEFVTKGIGNGGGHAMKAAGFISSGLAADEISRDEISDFFEGKMLSYLESFDVAWYDELKIDVEKLPLYAEKEHNLGYFVSSEVVASGATVKLRSAKGDVSFQASSNKYIVTDKSGRCFPVDKPDFDFHYLPVDDSFEFDGCDYTPTIITDDNVAHEITRYFRPCVTRHANPVYVKRLERSLKLYTKHDRNDYLMGQEGDYLAVKVEDPSDIYIIDVAILESLYEKLS